MLEDATAWVEQELATVALGDARLARRSQALLRRMSAQCQASLPVACHGWAEIKAAYRFFAHPQVTLGTILAAHRDATVARVAAHPVVIVAQDTTELDLTGTRVAPQLGPLTQTHRHGWLAHLSLAVTPDRVCLGVLAAQVWTRAADDPHKKRRRKQTPFAEKESARWLQGYTHACTLARQAPDTQVVSVADREGDIYELYVAAAAGEAAWVVRAAQDRSLLGHPSAPGGVAAKLWDALAAAGVRGEVVCTLPAKGGRPARPVQLTARATTLTLRPPYRVGDTLAPVEVRAVLLREEAPPADTAPVEWLLVTSLPVATWAEVQVVIDCYLCRWQIECYFKVLKSGCQVEKLQLQTPERLLACLGLYLIVAWRVLYLTMLGRVCPDLPCTVVFADAEWKAVTMIETGQLPASTPPSLGTMVRAIARQGSYVGRAGDGHPGSISIWTGLQRVMDYARAWEAFGPERTTYG